MDSDDEPTTLPRNMPSDSDATDETMDSDDEPTTVSSKRPSGSDPDSDASDSEEMFNQQTVQLQDELRKQRSLMSFEELDALKQKVGLKKFNEIFGTAKTKPIKKQTEEVTLKRENKNRPQIISSKRPHKRPPLIQVKKRMSRDPRFDDLSGEYREDLFAGSYTFISDIKQREKQKLLQAFSKEKNEEKKKRIEAHINKLKQEDVQKKKDEVKKSQKSIVKQHEKALISKGKKPFYLKKSDQKTIELAAQFKELKKAGKLDDYLKKKRKKTKSKAQRRMPSTGN